MHIRDEIQRILRKPGQTKAGAFAEVCRLADRLNSEVIRRDDKIAELQQRLDAHEYPCTHS